MRYAIPLIIALIAVLAAWWYKQEANRVNALYANSMANNELLINRMRKVYDDKLETDRRRQQLEEEIKKDKSGFDWNYDLSSNVVLLRFKQLQK